MSDTDTPKTEPARARAPAVDRRHEAAASRLGKPRPRHRKTARSWPRSTPCTTGSGLTCRRRSNPFHQFSWGGETAVGMRLNGRVRRPNFLLVYPPFLGKRSSVAAVIASVGGGGGWAITTGASGAQNGECSEGSSISSFCALIPFRLRHPAHPEDQRFDVVRIGAVKLAEILPAHHAGGFEHPPFKPLLEARHHLLGKLGRCG